VRFDLKTIKVTAAIIQDSDGKYLLARRKKNSHMEMRWEFPGGKIEEGESPEDCLARELHEEFGITATIGSYFGISEFDYGEKHITLLAYRVDNFSGEFEVNAHEEIKWVKLEDFKDYHFADADIPFVEKLKG
jgi:8-oxo-dGTP diphosphatase